MNLTYLRAFCQLAELEHYGKTAEELEMAQPSLSRIIKKMEEELNVVLFQHKGRNIELTKLGRVYYQSVKRSLAELDEGEKKIKEISDPFSGTIDLGVIFTLGPELLPQLLKRFISIEKNKNFNFKFWQGNTPRLLEHVKKDICDLTFCSYMPDKPEIEFTHILDQNLVAIVAEKSPLAKKKEISLAELAEYPMVLLMDKVHYIEQLFYEEQLSFKVACRVEEDQAIAGLVSINLGVSILPYNNLLQHYPIKILKLTKPVKRSVYLAKKKNAILSSAAASFEKFLKENPF